VFDDREWDLLAAGLNRLGEIAAAQGLGVVTGERVTAKARSRGWR